MRERKFTSFWALTLNVFTSIICIGQVETYFVPPIVTDIAYAAMEDSSTISRNTDFQVNKLFLFLGGTNSSSSKNYNALRIHSAKLGFDFINLSYHNSVAAASLSSNSDSLAFNKYRQEICFGTQSSNAVEVDSLNSIHTRTLKLLQYLDSTYPTQNWGQYLSSENTINWINIVVGGHSQGAGHAAYFAKHYDVDRILMFSGPNDYSNTYATSANWLRQPGTTSIRKHFVYLSLEDEIVDFSKQFANVSGLGMLINDDSTHVDNIDPPYNLSHVLYTTQSPGIVIINHSSPIKLSAINNEVWTYMLTSTITSNAINETLDLDFDAFPIPTKSMITLEIPDALIGKNYILRNQIGQVIKVKRLTALNQKVDLSGMTSGAYYLTIDNKTLTIIKN